MDTNIEKTERPGKYFAAALVLAVPLGIVMSVLLLFSSSSMLTMLREFRANGSDSVSMGLAIRLDRLFLEKADAGNVLLRFDGFEGHSEDFREISSSGLAGLIYYRACYLLYPKRVHVCPENSIVARGDEFLAPAMPAFSPSKTWLREHAIRHIMTFTRVKGPQGYEIRCRVKDIP